MSDGTKDNLVTTDSDHILERHTGEGLSQEKLMEQISTNVLDDLTAKGIPYRKIKFAFDLTKDGVLKSRREELKPLIFRLLNDVGVHLRSSVEDAIQKKQDELRDINAQKSSIRRWWNRNHPSRPEQGILTEEKALTEIADMINKSRTQLLDALGDSFVDDDTEEAGGVRKLQRERKFLLWIHDTLIALHHDLQLPFFYHDDIEMQWGPINKAIPNLIADSEEASKLQQDLHLKLADFKRNMEETMHRGEHHIYKDRLMGLIAVFTEYSATVINLMRDEINNFKSKKTADFLKQS